MSKEEFLRAMDELLELPVGTLKGGEALAELENWDSVAMVSFIALVDEHFNLKLPPRQIREAETVDQLFDLTQGK